MKKHIAAMFLALFLLGATSARAEPGTWVAEAGGGARAANTTSTNPTNPASGITILLQVLQALMRL